MGGEVVDAAIVPVAGVTMVVVLRVPMEHADQLGHWSAAARGAVVDVTPPPCPFVVDWRVRESGLAGRVSGPKGGEPIGIHALPPQP